MSIEALETDLMSTSGYKSNKTGFSIDTNFEYFDDLMLRVDNHLFMNQSQLILQHLRDKKNKKEIIGILLYL